jgi:hypothetical protein
MSDAPLPGPLEDFLQEPPPPPAAEPLRAAVLAQTIGVLRRRRQRRRVLIVGGAAAALVLAGLALHAGLRSGDDEPAPPASAADQPRLRPPPAPHPGPAQGPQNLGPAAKTPLEQEWAAFDAEPRARARLYFKTGDRYLNECQDIESALRCYRQALLLCEARDLAFDPNDNWLVMALKQDHRKEQ